jgi:hypothetical protein
MNVFEHFDNLFSNACETIDNGTNDSPCVMCGYEGANQDDFYIDGCIDCMGAL